MGYGQLESKDQEDTGERKIGMVDVKKRYRAAASYTKPVLCQGCGEELKETELRGVEYVKTKRGTDIFFHTECADKVWKSKIV